jgi:hypothetical protein
MAWALGFRIQRRDIIQRRRRRQDLGETPKSSPKEFQSHSGASWTLRRLFGFNRDSILACKMKGAVLLAGIVFSIS